MKKRFTLTDRGHLWLLAAVTAFLLALSVLAIWFSVREDSGQPVLKIGTDLRLPLDDLDKGELRLFRYALDSATTTQVAVQRGKDGQIRVAFASCRNCQSFGYYRQFDQIICSRCRHSMRLPSPGEMPNQKTGCIPVALPYSVEGDQLVVRGPAIKEEFHRWYRPSTGVHGN